MAVLPDPKPARSSSISGARSQGIPRPIRSESRARLVEGIAKARLWLEDLVTGRVKNTEEISIRENCSERSVRMTLNLAFLGPRIVKAAVDGSLPFGSGASRLTGAAAAWERQLQQI